MEDYLFELVGGDNIVDYNTIAKYMENAGVPILNEDDVEKFIDNLVDLIILEEK